MPTAIDSSVFVFDTSIISLLLRETPESLLERIRTSGSSTLVLCEAVIFEVERGLKHRNAVKQLQRFQDEIIPLFSVTPVILADWRVAATLWSTMRSQGKQFSDVDLLIASLALRLNGIIVTTDRDFDAIPVQRENWQP